MPDTAYTHGTHTTDVAVIGAGILGLMNALGLAKRGYKVTLVDNVVQQKRSFKVGESLLVFSNGFLRTIGGLDHYLQHSYPKDGVWFTYGMEGEESFDAKTEWAFQAKVPPRWRDNIKNPKFARSMFYDAQIVRPEAEDLLRAQVRANPNITFLDSALVRELVVADDDASPHVLRWKCGVTNGEGAIEARWMIDCSGRRRLLAKTLGHVADERFMTDGFQTTAVWAQFDHIDDKLFGEAWRYDFADGDEVGREPGGDAPKTYRDRCTLHLWGEGYWIWVIRLTGDPEHPENRQRVSIGVTWDQKQKPPGATDKERFWNVIQRYPILTRALKEEHVLEFSVYRNVQYMTDTFVSERRYGMVGDAASIIDAYYSQGVSLSLVTSWHIANIIDSDIRDGAMDKEYIDIVNRHTRADWHMMRNTIIEKYTSAIKDPRFFILSHLLDFTMLGSITGSRWRLARWLAETDGYSSRETPYHRTAKKKLRKGLYFSRSIFPGNLPPELVHKLTRRLQAGIAERARWRIENGVQLGEAKVVARAAGMLPNVFGMIGTKPGTVTDLSPSVINAPDNMLPTGIEDTPVMFKVAPRVILSLFLSMYAYDAAETRARKVLRRLTGAPRAPARAMPNGTKPSNGHDTMKGDAMPSMKAPPSVQAAGEMLKKGDPMPDVLVTGEDASRRHLSDYWRERPTAFVFIRHLNCPHCRIELRKLHRDRAQIESAGGRIVVVTMGTPAKVAEFKSVMKLDFPHIADEEEAAYDACGLLMAPNTLGDNLQAVSRELPFALKQMAKGEHGRIIHGGNGWRLGGTFITDKQGRLAYVFRARSTSSMAPFEEILDAFRAIDAQAGHANGVASPSGDGMAMTSAPQAGE